MDKSYKFIYKFMPFEQFIDTVQKKKLHFVHPSEWEAPKELLGVNYYIDCIESPELKNSLFVATGYHFAQSWTSLKESDALWRIYASGKSSVRICIDTASIEKLDGVVSKKITYVKDIKSCAEKIGKNNDEIINAFCIKSNFFRHENEVRLIKQVKLANYAEVDNALLRAIPVISSDKSQYTSREEMRKSLFRDIRIANNMPPYKKISFAHIDNFIKSVMVSPFADKWILDMVEAYCKKNGLKFIGKSRHYCDL